MNCFFSGVDKDELFENAPNHNFYLSLIVNYKDHKNWCAKVAVMTERVTEGELKVTTNWLGKLDKIFFKSDESIKEVEKIMYTIDLNIKLEEECDENNEIGNRIKQLAELKEEKEKASKSTVAYDGYSRWDTSSGATKGSSNAYKGRSWSATEPSEVVTKKNKDLILLYNLNKEEGGKLRTGKNKNKISLDEVVFEPSTLETVINHSLTNIIEKYSVAAFSKQYSLYSNLKASYYAARNTQEEMKQELNKKFGEELLSNFELLLETVIKPSELIGNSKKLIKANDEKFFHLTMAALKLSINSLIDKHSSLGYEMYGKEVAQEFTFILINSIKETIDSFIEAKESPLGLVFLCSGQRISNAKLEENIENFLKKVKSDKKETIVKEYRGWEDQWED